MRNFQQRTRKTLASVAVFGVIACLALGLAGTAKAGTFYWVGGAAPDANTWFDANNWQIAAKDQTHPTVAPGAGDQAWAFTRGLDSNSAPGDQATFINDGTIYFGSSDIGSLAARLTSFQLNYGQTVRLIGTGTMYVGTFTSRETSQHYANINIDANLVTWGYRGNSMEYNGHVRADKVIFGGTERLNGGFEVTGAQGIELVVGNYANPNVQANSLVTTPLMNINKGGWNAKDPNASGGSSAVINLNAPGTFYNLAVTQNAFPAMINTAAYSAIKGDMTGAVYGTNTNLVEDTILGITAGPVPVDANPAVADAKYWLLADSPSSIAVYEASNDPNSIYKGVAFTNSLMSSGNAGCTFQTAAGSTEDLQVLIVLGGRKKTSAMTWLSETGVADIYCSGTSLTGDGGGINENYTNSPPDPNRTMVTTFNFHNLNTADGYETNTLYNHGGSAKILAGQTYTIENGVISVGTSNILGDIVVKDKGAAYITTNLAAASTGTITVEAGGAIIVNDVNRLESFGGTIVTPTATTLCFNMGTINLVAASQPVLHSLIAKADIGLNWHGDATYTFSGDGLMLADGKFLMVGGYQSKTTTIAAASTLGAAVGASEIGLAAGSGQYLKIDCPLNLGSTVDLNINSTTLEIVTNSNRRDDPTGYVRFNSTVTAKDIKVAAGRAEFLDGSDLILSGKVLVTGGEVRIGAASDEFNDTQAVDMQFDGGMLNCNEGQGLLNLSTSNIALNSGSYGYFTPSETRVGDLSIAEKFVNNVSGVRVNDGADVLTVTGTLSGNGGWGGNGKMSVEGTLAPGASVGELTGASPLELADGAEYDWQIADPTGVAGTDWDLVTGTNVTFLGELIFNIDGSFLTDTVAAENEFIVASATSTLTGPSSYTINLPSGWSGTGTLTVAGSDLVLSGVSSALIGDADDNGVVNAADYIILKTNMGGATGAGAADGDFNGDGKVDWNDLQLLRDHYGEGSAASGVIPEPGSAILLMFGAAALLRRRRGIIVRPRG